MDIIIRGIDGLQNKYQTLTEDDFLVVIESVSFYWNCGGVDLRYPSSRAYDYLLSYDASIGKLTFRQPYASWGVSQWQGSGLGTYEAGVYAMPCTVYWKSTDLPTAP